MTACKQCLNETNNPRFCSSSCAARFNNQGVRRNGKAPTFRTCGGCGDQTSNPLYCSNICRGLWQRKEAFERVRKGLVSTRETLRKFLIAERGHECEICNLTEWLGKPIMLIVDHINGDSDNNLPENIRLICSNCDATLPTYKGKNIGSGNSMRNKRRRSRYAETKTTESIRS